MTKLGGNWGKKKATKQQSKCVGIISHLLALNRPD